MSFDYSEVAADALETLTEFGRSITRRAYSAGAYDPATGTTANTTADTTRLGALFDYTDQGRSGQQYVRGTLVEKGDKQLLMDATGPATLSDHYIVGSVEYTVVSVGEVNPAGTPVIYDLHLRVS